MTRRLASQLDRDGVEATAIHGDRTQPERERALEMFKAGDVRVLVATDVAARGLDIEALPMVVNFEIPYDPEDYVHRIGRTGRAGMAGLAISLVSLEEEDQLKAINRLLKRDLPVRQVRGFEVDPAAMPAAAEAQPRSAAAPPGASAGRAHAARRTSGPPRTGVGGPAGPPEAAGQLAGSARRPKPPRARGSSRSRSSPTSRAAGGAAPSESSRRPTRSRTAPRRLARPSGRGRAARA